MTDADDRAALAGRLRAVQIENEAIEKLKRAVDAWREFYYNGKPMTPAEHNPAKHAQTCKRLRIEDDHVVAAFCGGYLYDPGEPCTCGADPNWKTRAEAAEARLRAVEAQQAELVNAAWWVVNEWMCKRSSVPPMERLRAALGALGIHWQGSLPAAGVVPSPQSCTCGVHQTCSICATPLTAQTLLQTVMAAPLANTDS